MSKSKRRSRPAPAQANTPIQTTAPAGPFTDEPMVGPADVAVRLGVPKSWVYAKSEAGELPSYKIGRYRRFKWSEIQEYMRACHNPSKPQHITEARNGKTPDARRSARGVFS